MMTTPYFAQIWSPEQLGSCDFSVTDSTQVTPPLQLNVESFSAFTQTLDMTPYNGTVSKPWLELDITGTEKSQLPSCSGDQICAKYGVVIIKDKIYKCSDGKVYNEAEFKARYDTITILPKPEKKIPCYKDRGSSDYIKYCDDGMNFYIDTDEKGNKVYENEYVRLSEKEFLDKYEILNFDEPIAVYGPPCMFTGTCDEKK